MLKFILAAVIIFVIVFSIVPLWTAHVEVCSESSQTHKYYIFKGQFSQFLEDKDNNPDNQVRGWQTAIGLPAQLQDCSGIAKPFPMSKITYRLYVL
jgi:hypothetical protein